MYLSLPLLGDCLLLENAAACQDKDVQDLLSESVRTSRNEKRPPPERKTLSFFFYIYICLEIVPSERLNKD